MNIGIITIVVIIVAFLVLKSILSFTLKVIGLGILILALALTIWICTAQPELHKPLSLNTIEYLLKINKDGSVTTTKQVTQTVMKQEVKQ
jgi:hypothetical protein